MAQAIVHTSSPSTKTLDAKKDIVKSHLGLVRYVASKFGFIHSPNERVLEENDLIQIGLVGLLDAIARTGLVCGGPSPARSLPGDDVRYCPRVRNARGRLRTDAGAGRCEWVRGRAVPVVKQPVGLPAIFRWSIGDRLGFSQAGRVENFTAYTHTVLCAHYNTGLLVLA